MELKLRYYIIMFALLSVFAVSNAANTGDVLVVEPNDNTQKTAYFYLSDTPSIVFGAHEIVVCYQADSKEEFTSFVYSAVKRIYVTSQESSSEESGGTTSVDEELKKENVFSFQYVDGQTVRIAGIEQDTFIGLYSIDGKKVPMDADRTTDVIVINLGSLPRGIYVIRCNSQSFKIYKKS